MPKTTLPMNSLRSLRWLPLVAVLSIGSAPWAQQRTPHAPALPPAGSEGAEWGRASDARPAAPLLAQVGGDYFHDFGELILRVRSVRWIAEICGEAAPATATDNRRAYAGWYRAHKAFVDEMEGQFAIIEAYWADASPQARQEGLTAQQLRIKVDANREGLQRDMVAKGQPALLKRCQAYPAILRSQQLDFERTQADEVRSVRLGPR